MCAAHAAAVLACDTHYPVVQHSDSGLASCLFALVDVAVLGPMAVVLDPALQKLIEELWSRAARQVSSIP